MIQVSAGLVLCLAAAAGCGQPTDHPAAVPAGVAPAASRGGAASPTGIAAASPARVAPAAPSGVAPAAVHANELGQVPVLMIHQVEQRPQGEFAQSPAQLRATLEYLATHGYLPITAAELVTGEIDIPAGTSPVVLTFDDGLANQFRLLADGRVDPLSGVGVVLSVAAKHPGFRPVGTMYVNRLPFGKLDPTQELHWLVDHGWEIGNHTYRHDNLGSLSPARIQQAIADQDRYIDTLVPGYPVTTLALPYGIMPKQAALAHRGSASGMSYNYRGVMLVGANPAPSPFAADWDPFNIPRIRSWYGRIDLDEHYWLPRLEKTRYISDGDPSRVSFPRSDTTPVAKAVAARANPY
jgi:peptidoglycan/xylan/chitin deacetylase (PgdA/CDA1 family)